MKRISTQGKVEIRPVSLRPEVARHLDALPKGTRSRFVDAAIAEKVQRERQNRATA